MTEAWVTGTHADQGGKAPLPRAQLERILAFENQVYVAQIWDARGGSLVEPDDWRVSRRVEIQP